MTALENPTNASRDEDRTGTTPAGVMQHGSSSGEGGNVGKPAGLVRQKAHRVAMAEMMGL